MKIKPTSKHMADFIFPLLLLVIFALSALVVTILGANVYQGNVERYTANNSSRTALEYVVSKVHSSDNSGDISLRDFQGCQSLQITTELNSRTFTTYIFEHNGQLKEIFASKGADISPDSGKVIADISDLKMQLNSKGLLSLKLRDSHDQVHDVSVYIRSAH